MSGVVLPTVIHVAGGPLPLFRDAIKKSAGRDPDEIYIAEMDFGLRRRAAPAINESPNH
jgi:hypothetical protein